MEPINQVRTFFNFDIVIGRREMNETYTPLENIFIMIFMKFRYAIKFSYAKDIIQYFEYHNFGL